MVGMGGFPAGLNNRAADTAGPVNDNGAQTSLREAVNVSLHNDGSPFRRPGQTQRVTGKAHSLFAFHDWLLSVVDGELRGYRQAQDGSLTLDVTLATPGDRFCSFASDDYSAWWSNGVRSGSAHRTPSP